MFGIEILDVVIGLMFVYLLLAMLTTAINEYVAAVMNLRGKELARGLGRLLDDLDDRDALKQAFAGVGPAVTTATATLTERFYNHRLVRPLATRRGWAFHAFSREPRLPSYIPARTFALALLDVLGYAEPDAADPATPPGGPQGTALVEIMRILKRESPLDVSELKGLLANASLPDALQVRLLEAFTGSQNRLQHLHDGVEVWFNNAMDRVSGAYKRNVQGWLFVIGLTVAGAMNADTISLWRQLAASDELREALAERAAATLPALEPAVRRAPGDSLSVDSARANFDAAVAELEALELKFGWSAENPWPADFWPRVLKVLGLLLTAVAVSLGAPFWFDLLNKVISIRAAGRSPAERPKSPEGGPKRTAEQTPK